MLRRGCQLLIQPDILAREDMEPSFFSCQASAVEGLSYLEWFLCERNSLPQRVILQPQMQPVLSLAFGSSWWTLEI